MKRARQVSIFEYLGDDYIAYFWAHAFLMGLRVGKEIHIIMDRDYE